MNIYRHFSTQDELDAEYNLGAATSDLAQHLRRYLNESESTRAETSCLLDVAYGPTVAEYMDIFLPANAATAPVMVFIHGGYWRALTSKDFSFVARGLCAAGFVVAVTNYELCPNVTITEITRQNRAAVCKLAESADGFGGDPERIFIMGHSAGGHQAAMLMCTDWPTEYGLSRDITKAGICISGVFDLEPLRYSYLQPVLQLDHEIIRRQSPCRVVPETPQPLLLTLGETEPDEFHRQSRQFAEIWTAAGGDSQFEIRAGHGHFTVIDDLGVPGSDFCQRIRDFCDGVAG